MKHTPDGWRETNCRLAGIVVEALEDWLVLWLRHVVVTEWKLLLCDQVYSVLLCAIWMDVI